ncbi:MAG: recombinase family protein, partial [Clostridium sp.]
TIAERIKDNMLELSKTGRWLGGTCPLGFKSIAVEYESNGHKKKMYELEIVPEEIEIVKLIYSLYLDSKSCSHVARYLCSNSIKGKNGGDFSRTTVRQIFINPVYCVADSDALQYFKSKGALITGEPSLNKGLMAYNKRKNGKIDNPMSDWIISTGGHMGVISSTDWIKCQSILEEVRGRASNRQGTGNKFLLSGMLKCDHCGSPMCSWSSNSPKGKYEKYYKCQLKTRASNRCICKMLNAYVADEFVINLLKDFNITQIENFKDIDNCRFDIINSEKEKSRLNKMLNDNNKMVAGLIRKLALIDDLEILSMIQKEIKQIKIDNENINKSINDINLNTFNLEDEKENKLAFIESFNIFKTTIDFISDIGVKRNMIKTLVKEFTYNSLTKEIKFKIRL